MRGSSLSPVVQRDVYGSYTPRNPYFPQVSQRRCAVQTPRCDADPAIHHEPPPHATTIVVMFDGGSRCHTTVSPFLLPAGKRDAAGGHTAVAACRCAYGECRHRARLCMRDHDAGIRTDAYPCHKTPWKAEKATIEFPRVSIAYMRGDTPLVLCQEATDTWRSFKHGPLTCSPRGRCEGDRHTRPCFV